MRYKDNSKEAFSSEELFHYYNKQTLSYKKKLVLELEKKLLEALDSKSKQIFDDYRIAMLDMHKKELQINFILAFRQGANFSL